MQLGALLRIHTIGRNQGQIHAVRQVQAAQIDAHRLIAHTRGGQSLLLSARRTQRQGQHKHQGQAAANGPSVAKHDKAASFNKQCERFRA